MVLGSCLISSEPLQACANMRKEEEKKSSGVPVPYPTWDDIDRKRERDKVPQVRTFSVLLLLLPWHADG